MTVSGDGKSMNGSSTWTVTENGSTCQGTSQLFAVKKGGGDDTDVTGTWAFHEEGDLTSCGGGTFSDDYDVVMTQSGNTVTVNGLSGTIDGNQLTFTVATTEDGNTITIDYSLTVSQDGNSMNGSSTITITGDLNCSGSSQITATRK